MPGQITIHTTQNVDLSYQVASLGERIVAYIIDALIRVALLIAFFVILGVLTPDFILGGLGPVGVIITILFALPFIFYHLLFEIFNNGQSPGKRIFDLRVVSVRGEMVSIASYFLRWLFRIVDFHIFSGLVAVIAVASNQKGQRVGDMVAGTTVIKENRRVVFRHLAYEETQNAYVPTYPQAAQLQPAHIELIKETLNYLEVEQADGHVQLLADKTAQIMGVTFEVQPRKFLRTVVDDYSAASK